MATSKPSTTKFPCLDCQVADVCGHRAAMMELIAPVLAQNDRSVAALSHRVGQLDIVPGETPDAYSRRIREFLVPDPDATPASRTLSPSRAELLVAAYFEGCRRQSPN